ncbi:MAG: recombinase family protein [Beijerinckiaceae bacterium]|nr:recombinase family protein [Beijerinckiaceae bacterium]MCZ8298988.1 recombinase family protein [Beijerinckiaceae bacterium]
MPEARKKPRSSISTHNSRKPAARATKGVGDHTGPVRRCAIYTRKSSEEGLEQDFNSLQAQREACEAYIASQRQEGWRLLPHEYNDGGFSGGSMERPGLKQLLQDVEAGRIDIVVVYKVDRLTRSLADFAKIVEIFDARGASFVSVTQSFNTTTSMGRLTLNVLLSFAQFEREVTAERIRDKIAASKRKGIFMGGPVPLGYRVENRKLLVVEEEADAIRTIFQTYLATRSTILASRELDRLGIRTRSRQLRDGRQKGGIPFAYGSLQALLRNRIYIGEISHKGEWFPGEHTAILDHATFQAVQTCLETGRASDTRSAHRMQSLLTGRIFDSNGNRMAPSHTNKRGVRYRYYISRALLEERREEAGNPARVRADDIEALVVETLRKEAASGKGASAVPAIERNSDDQLLVSSCLDRVDVHDDRIELSLRDDSEHVGEEEARATAPRIVLACVLGFTQTHKQVMEAGGAFSQEGSADQSAQRRNRDRLLVAIHKARQWLDELTSGQARGIVEIADREGKSRRNISMMINLAFVAPSLVEHLLEGEGTTLTATNLAQILPDPWNEQVKFVTLKGG